MSDTGQCFSSHAIEWPEERVTHVYVHHFSFFLFFFFLLLKKVLGYQMMGSGSWYRLLFMIQWQLTSSGKMRVRSYTVAIVTPAWCLVGRHFMTSFVVTEPFFVGGGCRIRAGEFGGKPNESIWEKLTAACWQAHVKMMTFRRWASCSMLETDDGKPWSVSPSLTGYPFSWRSRIHACNSVSCKIWMNDACH